VTVDSDDSLSRGGDT